MTRDDAVEILTTARELYPGKSVIRDAFTLALSALPPPNKPLTQADLDSMDYDKVWLDYGADGEWALVVHGRIYSLSNLEGCGFEEIMRAEVASDTIDCPSGDYTVYRRPPEGEQAHHG
nr:MAG TPA_asm: hypothetical protein [Caudoviricetes sp.]